MYLEKYKRVTFPFWKHILMWSSPSVLTTEAIVSFHVWITLELESQIVNFIYAPLDVIDIYLFNLQMQK